MKMRATIPRVQDLILKKMIRSVIVRMMNVAVKMMSAVAALVSITITTITIIRGSSGNKIYKIV